MKAQFAIPLMTGLLVGSNLTAQRSGVIPEWPLSRSPTLTIGEDGTPAGEFQQIRGIALLSTGHIVVANAGTSELRIFDRTGRPVQTLGRPGEGPGEFRLIAWLGRAGDTLFVADAGLLRISRFLATPPARFVEAVTITAASDRGHVGVHGRLASGEWLVTTGANPGFEGPPGPRRILTSIGVARPDAGGNIEWLGEFPTMRVFVYNPTGNIREARVGATAFSPWAVQLAAGNTIWVSHGDTDSLLAFEGPRRSARVVRLPLVRRRVPKSLVRVSREERLALARDPRRFTEAVFTPPQLPTHLPYIERLFAGEGDELWVQEYTGHSSLPANYLILSGDGRPLGRVTTPAGFRIHEAGPDHVLGVHIDAEGLERVQRYRLTRR